MNNYLKEYDLDLDDFKRVFQFASNYYIDPNKSTTGRTTFEPRGLGAILDNFTIGKLTEIGVEKILSINEPSKHYILDFDIKGTSVVMDEPDIIKVLIGKEYREPNFHIEIKNTSDNDRWIGLTEEQFNTIRRSANGKQIYFIYASIFSPLSDDNPKRSNLTGMFLREIEDTQKSQIFQEFVKLNAKCRIEFIFSSEDLINFGYPFEKGMNMYETQLFKEVKINSVFSKNGFRKDIIKQEEYKSEDTIIHLELNNGIKPENEYFSKILITGHFKLLSKMRSKFIIPISPVNISSGIFGDFLLEAGNVYNFSLKTLGRDPKLKRNNLFIAKRKVIQLMEKNILRQPDELIKSIATQI